ncbi:PepSY-associated TM helix domain-containing protein [Reyranella sp.]|uniref:PepSY-associated TM helix domain-containing protein n=1 Tax=Reyranella sp. TaxID=1929291 RepID=UPI003D09FA59
MNKPTPAQVRHIRRTLLWRIHLWAALIASPFAVVACLTGLLYAFTPQIEKSLYGRLDRVAPAERRLPLDEAVAAARLVAPSGFVLHSVVPAHGPTDAVRVAFLPPAAPVGHAGHGASVASPKAPAFLRPNFGIPGRATVVYVDPYTAEVTGVLPEAERFSNWARRLHSSLMQGDGWRWMIELGASWMMVMLLTGIVLWWPGSGQAGLPARGATGRTAWRQWHAFVGVALSLVSLAILSTGLTWSRTAGSQIRWARDVTGQTPPRIPATFASVVPEGVGMMSWEQALQAVAAQSPDSVTQIMPPTGPTGYWRVNQLEKTGQPTRSFDLLLDAYSGRPLYRSGWAEQTAFGKATAIGIPFHRGEYGLWNQALLVLFGAGILFSLISGWTMFFKRWKRGQPVLPSSMPDAWRHASLWAWPTGAVLMLAMPLLAATALPVALAEAFAAWRASRRASWRIDRAGAV